MNTDRIAKAYRCWRRYRDTYNELMRMSDHDLWDIGVRRGEIPAIAKAHAAQ